MKPYIEYLPDADVTDAIDHELRGLLTTCFTKPQDVVFRHQRYFREPYQHRWVIRDENSTIVSHIGVHEKHVMAAGQSFRIGGICEVCVHPNCRGKGYVKLMIHCVHTWLPRHGFVFAVLFGSPLVYASSGYTQIDNLVHGTEKEGWKSVKAMVHEVALTSWPNGEVRLPGPTF